MNADSARAAVSAISSSISRALPPPAVDTLASRDRSPLWLRLAIAELLALAARDYTEVNPAADPLDETARVINSTVAALPPATEALVDRVIGRAADRFGDEAVRSVLAYCAVSRSGLRPLDIEQLVGLDALTVAGIRRSLSPLLAPRREGGRLGFTHAIIRTHFRTSIPDHEIERLHGELVTYLATADDDPLCTDDRLWHAFRAPSHHATVSTLLARTNKAQLPKVAAIIVDSVDAPYFRAGLSELTAHGVTILSKAAHWHKSEATASTRVALAFALFDAARQMLDRGDSTPAALAAFSNAAGCLADLPAVSGVDVLPALTAAREFTRQQLSAHPDEISLIGAFALTTMGVARESPDQSTAIAELTRACDAWETISHRQPGLHADSWYQYALTLLGGAYRAAGEHAAARTAYLRALPLADRVDNDPELRTHNSVGNLVNIRIGLGEVAIALGHHADARDHFGAALRSAQDSYLRNPDISGTGILAMSAQGYGRALFNLGEHQAAHRWLDDADQLFRRRGQLEPDTAEWRAGATAVAFAAEGDIVVGQGDAARWRVSSYLDSTPHRDKAFGVIAQGFLHTARKNRRRLAEPLAQLVVDTAKRVASADEPDSRTTSAPMSFEEIAEQAMANVRGDRNVTYGPHVAAVCDALELIAGQRAGKRDPRCLEVLDEAIELRTRRLKGSPIDYVTDRARELGRALLLEANELPGPDRAQAAANIAYHWDTYLADDDGNTADNRMLTLGLGLAQLAANEPAQADTLFPAAARYASAVVAAFPKNESHRANLVAVLDTWGVHQANSGHSEDAVDTWIRAARSAGGPSSDEFLKRMRKSLARNLRQISRSRIIKRSRRKECARWADRLDGSS
ncbi:MAG: tetratricopeptide repeat protein [Gordonia sp. (in: high G+C Gram-positive bacteria)]